MINEIIKGVSMKLNTTFGAGYKSIRMMWNRVSKNPVFSLPF